MKEINKKAFAYDLINWYKENKRDLPWRMNAEPYRIWISEIMLQQTQVSTVIPYYLNFMSLFPTVFELAKSNLEDVYKAWEGLGYYSRARHLHESAKVIVEKYNGIFPNKYDEILALKGIGSYTAGAICSIAYHQKVSAVDGNVMRVMSRVLSIWDDIKLNQTKKLIETIMYELVPEESPSSFNQGLMELGALICKPKGQKCRECPVHAHCTAYHNGYDDELPVKSSKTKQKKQLLVTGIIENEKNEYLMRKRPEQGMLAGLWEFIQVEGHDYRDLSLFLQEHYYLVLESPRELGIVNHVFTHRIWIMTVYHANVNTDRSLPPYLKFMSLADIENVPVSTAHKKVFELIK